MIWLIDASYVSYRSFFGMPNLGADAVLFGNVRLATQIMDIDPAAIVVWCFDVGTPKRRKLYPEYKANRGKKPKHENIDAFYKSLSLMRTIQLHEIGFENTLWLDGYEADDIIASVANDPRNGEMEIVIVSSDHDLYQLLRSNVRMFNIRTQMFYTVEHFKNEYGLSPTKWPHVKAIAGCSSDNVVGVRGVGEKTAVKFLNGELKPHTKAFQSITERRDACVENMPLVRLPFDGTPSFDLVYDVLREKGNANTVLREHGIHDLRF